jgi:hypothetical protein
VARPSQYLAAYFQSFAREPFRPFCLATMLECVLIFPSVLRRYPAGHPTPTVWLASLVTGTRSSLSALHAAADVDGQFTLHRVDLLISVDPHPEGLEHTEHCLATGMKPRCRLSAPSESGNSLFALRPPAPPATLAQRATLN